MTDRILVTGGSGFIAGHVILQLLDAGYAVRATIRSLAKEPSVRAVLERAGMLRGDAVEFVAADLMADAGWAEALTGVDAVMHVASPVMPGHVDDEQQVIAPAREGTMRVLRAAVAAGVARVVLTSAFHAVSWGHPHDDHVFTEADWTVVDGPGSDAYARAKTLAERDAWAFAAEVGERLALTTFLPVAVMGPVMGANVSGSNHIVQSMLTGAMAATPNLFIPVVDVRDVAAAHVAALTHPATIGERILLASGPVMPMREIAATIRAAVGDAAPNATHRSIPDVVVRLASIVRPELRQVARDLGYAKRLDTAKAVRLLDWRPRPATEAISSAAVSLLPTS